MTGPCPADREWLSVIEHLPESDLPCNPSTVAHAIKVAVKFREQADAMYAALEQITSCPNPNSVEDCHDLMWDTAQQCLFGGES